MHRRIENISTKIGVLLSGLCLIIASACHRAEANKTAPIMAVSTSYLEAAAKDLLGKDICIMRLAEPGTCPGHFDIRPSQVVEGRKCRVLLRFDFQKSLDLKFASANNQPQVIEVAVRGGMCLPNSYLATCQTIATNFVQCGLLSQSIAENRLKDIAVRLDAWIQKATNRLSQAGLSGMPVLASDHQRDFCEWLGLNVVATFRSADSASISEIENAIAAGKLASVKQVIANLPEGRRTADALAERLKARTVVFGNFPALKDGHLSFAQLISENLEALIQAAPQ